MSDAHITERELPLCLRVTNTRVYKCTCTCTRRAAVLAKLPTCAGVSMSAFHHLTEAHALALGGVPMSFLRNETSHSRRGTSSSARQPRRACVAAARCC